jgi:hypothetical protein
VPESDVEILHRTYMEYGWNRFLPDGAIQLLAIIAGGQLDTADLDLQLRESQHSADGLESAAWSPLEVYTDEALAELHGLFDRAPMVVGDDESETADEVMALEAAARAEEVQQMRRFSDHLHVSEVRTLGDLLTFMAEADLITHSSGVWKLNATAPLPEESLPLTPEQREYEDELRWALLHERPAQGIIRLFRPDGIAPADTLTTSLTALASELDVPVEAARGALVELIRAADFSADTDPATCEEDDILTIAIDWDTFHTTRIHLGSSNA